MKVVFRVDSSLDLGLGHLMRCLILADALRKKGVNVFFVCRELFNNGILLLQKKGFVVKRLSDDDIAYRKLADIKPFSVEKQRLDAERTKECFAKNEQADWMVVDHYGLGDVWGNTIRTFAKKLMVIDDLANRKFVCDLLLNGNYYTNKEQRSITAD